MKISTTGALIVSAAFTALVLNPGVMRNAHASQSSVNRNMSVSANSGAEDASSVNGKLELSAGANAKDLSNVNGDIKLGGNNSVHDISSVNGDIEGGKSLKVNGDVSSVNGDIELGLDSHISGEITTVNGELDFASGSVGKDISTVNGDLELGSVTVQGNVFTTWGDVVLNGAAVMGELRVKKPRMSNWWGKNTQPPRIVIGVGARVAGVITLEQPAKIFVHQDAQMPKVSGEMVGGAVVRFTGAKAPN